MTGEQLGRKAANSGQAGAERREAYLERLLAAEPHAAAERRRYLAWQATVATRPTAPYTDVTASWSKSISVLHRPIVREGITGLADASAAGRSIWPAGFGERTFKVDQVEVGREAPPDHIRLLLDLPDEEAVVVVRKRRYVLDGKPVLVSVSYLPSDVTSGTRIEQEDTGPGGTYARLAETGHAPVRFREDLRSRMPEPSESEQLGIPAGTPVVDIARTAYTESGRIVEVNEMTADSSAYIFRYDFNGRAGWQYGRDADGFDLDVVLE